MRQQVSHQNCILRGCSRRCVIEKNVSLSCLPSYRQKTPADFAQALTSVKPRIFDSGRSVQPHVCHRRCHPSGAGAAVHVMYAKTDFRGHQELLNVRLIPRRMAKFYYVIEISRQCADEAVEFIEVTLPTMVETDRGWVLCARRECVHRRTKPLVLDSGSCRHDGSNPCPL